MQIFQRDPNKKDSYAAPGSWVYIWRTKSKYILVVIAAILIIGGLAYYGLGPAA